MNFRGAGAFFGSRGIYDSLTFPRPRGSYPLTPLSKGRLILLSSGCSVQDFLTSYLFIVNELRYVEMLKLLK